MKEFRYRGKTLEELKNMDIKEFSMLLPARQRRSLIRGPTKEHKRIMESIKESKDEMIKTHKRDLVVLPEFVGLEFGIHNGKEFVKVKIMEDMIGHFIGEFSLTRKTTQHGTPGVGASRSSKFVPIK